MNNPRYVIENYIVEMRVEEGRGRDQKSSTTVAYEIIESLAQSGFPELKQAMDAIEEGTRHGF